MEKSELMKRYEAETGKRFSHMQKRAVEGDINCTMSTGYVAWLEAQLTWRPVREKPKEGQIVFVMVSTGWVVAQYLDGGFYVDDGFTFGDFISGVSHWLPIPPAPEGGRKMTREHRAWEMLIRRLNYLNTFGGNRSEMEKTTKMVLDIWDDTGHDELPEDPDHYPVENIGFDNAGEVLGGLEMDTQNCVEEQELKYMNECEIELDEFSENGFRMYVCKKAEAYDRLMSGGKVSNAKEAANFYGRPVASVDREWKVFENLPKYDGYRWWDMESRAFPSGETVHFNIDAFEGDEENSLTLPDGWEEK